MFNYEKNDMIAEWLHHYYGSFRDTLDTADFVPKRYNAWILRTIYKDMRKQRRLLNREYRRKQRAIRKAERAELLATKKSKKAARRALLKAKKQNLASERKAKRLERRIEKRKFRKERFSSFIRFFAGSSCRGSKLATIEKELNIPETGIEHK